MTTFDFSALSVNQKRDLVKQLRDEIKSQLAVKKSLRLSAKMQKEQNRKERLAKSILAAQEKLAKLQAKLTA